MGNIVKLVVMAIIVKLVVMEVTEILVVMVNIIMEAITLVVIIVTRE